MAEPALDSQTDGSGVAERVPREARRRRSQRRQRRAGAPAAAEPQGDAVGDSVEPEPEPSDGLDAVAAVEPPEPAELSLEPPPPDADASAVNRSGRKLLDRLRGHGERHEAIDDGSHAPEASLLGRLQRREAAPEAESVATGALLGRIARQMLRARAHCDLMVAFAAGHHTDTHAFGSLLCGSQSPAFRANHVNLPEVGRQAFLLLNAPRCDLPEIGRRPTRRIDAYLFSTHSEGLVALQVSSVLTYLPDGEDGTDGPRHAMPLLRVTAVGGGVSRPRPGPGLEGRLYGLLREKAVFADCLDVAIADVAVGQGGSAYRVAYWLQHRQSGNLPTGASLHERDIECIWSANKTTIVHQLNQSLECGAVYVSPSGYC